MSGLKRSTRRREATSEEPPPQAVNIAAHQVRTILGVFFDIDVSPCDPDRE
jgi:hypothetical protein